MKSPRSLFLWIALLLLAAPFVSAQSGARIMGKVVDENGNPVAGLTIEFSPVPGSTTSGFEVTTNKKGRFTNPAANVGGFVPKIKGDWHAVHLKLKHMGATSVAQAEGLDAAIAPGEEPPTVGWLQGGRVQLELTVAPGGIGGGPTVVGVEGGPSELQQLSDLFDDQDWDALISESETVLAGDPELGGAHYLRAVALWQTGSIPAAVESMRTAAELMPDQPGINGTLATLLLTHGGLLAEDGEADVAAEINGEAADLFLAQLEDSPGEVVYLTNRVAALDLAGRVDELPQAIEALLAVDATNVSAFLRLAELHVAAGEIDAAFEVLNTMPEGGESAASILYNAAVDMWNQGNMEATLAVVDKGIAIAPGMADLYRLKAMALISSDQAQAAELLAKYISMVPEDTEGLEADKSLLEALKERL
jgi:tetratricopeptide (TPR) repeat protein